MNIWNLTQLNFFMAVFLHRHVFSNGVFLVLNTLTANIQFLKIQLQVFKMKKKFGTSNSIFKIQKRRIQIVQKVGQRSSTGKSRWSPKSRTKHLLRPGGDMFGSLRLVLSWPWHIYSWERDIRRVRLEAALAEWSPYDIKVPREL